LIPGAEHATLESGQLLGLTFIVSVNPFGKTHGAPTDDVRHVGDLGNFKTDAQGNATGSVQDKLIKLIGAESVLGVSSRS
jgi:Cu/Zn superoxide dismutase